MKDDEDGAGKKELASRMLQLCDRVRTDLGAFMNSTCYREHIFFDIAIEHVREKYITCISSIDCVNEKFLFI